MKKSALFLSMSLALGLSACGGGGGGDSATPAPTPTPTPTLTGRCHLERSERSIFIIIVSLPKIAQGTSSK